MRDGRRILEGIHVLDFTWALAGPYATRMLADMGASVIKVDPPALTERGRSPRAAGNALSNLGKRSIGIDLKRAEGVAIARELAARADVLVENFSPGVMGRFGLASESLCASNPRLVYASISGFGQATPRRAYGAVAHAESGWIWMQQQQARSATPFAPGVQIADIVTGVHTYAAIVTALLDRERTGCGQSIDISLMDCQLALLTNAIQGVLNGSNPDGVPSAHAVYETRDGAHVTVNPGGELNFRFDRVANALGHPGAAEPEGRAGAEAIIRGWVADLTLDEVVSGMEREGAAYGVVRSLPEAADHPHYRGRGLFETVGHAGDGSGWAVGSAMFFSDAAAGPRDAAPLAGEHSRAILQELDYPAGRVEELIAGGVVFEHA